LRGQLADGRHRVLGAKGADDESPAHLVHDLEVQGPRIARIEIHRIREALA
jgi:hypothetical protein